MDHKNTQKTTKITENSGWNTKITENVDMEHKNQKMKIMKSYLNS